MSKEYIRASNESPRLPLGTILFWYMAIKFFSWPEWSLGVWGLCAVILLINFFYRIFTEDGVDVVKR